jgi:hypothetical protein
MEPMRPGITGVGDVRINETTLWALWIIEAGEADGRNRCWRVRVSLDEFECLSIHPYQRVRLQIQGHDEQHVYFRSRRDSPPWVWLEFALDVRR